MLSKLRVIALCTFFNVISLAAFAQDEASAATEQVAVNESESIWKTIGLYTDDPIVIALLSAIIVLFFVALYLKNTYAGLYREIYGREMVPAEKEITWEKVVTKMNEAVPVEKEHSILTDHDYDGIRELDNNLPLWWRYMFYGTIAFAFIYLFRFHVFNTGDLPLAEYNKEMAQAKIEMDEHRKKNAGNVDENNVVQLTDADGIGAGQKIFGDNCKACHGGAGEGGVGPNLTDEYWLHGGSIGDVFKSIKYGIPDKGMISWQAQLKPQQIQQVASFIMSLKGSNPANGKEPQGDLYKASGTPADTVKIDSVQVAVK